MDEYIKKEEQFHLKNITDKLSNAKLQLTKSLKVLGESTVERLQELREDITGSDFAFFLEQLHQKHQGFNVKDKLAHLEEFDYLIREPYFSRIDLKDKVSGEVSKYYIGKFGYTEDKPIITDWRAKVASVYYRYRYPQKNVKYETLGGTEIRDLTLKRTYEIYEGELVKYYNNDLQIDEKEIISEKIQERTGGVLEDIIETIQESQLNIIEADPRQVCIVQGCVGSGKSTVAIHKLSYVFFNYPNLIHPDKSILIAKNQILVGYLSTLFPKLGIFDINYKTLRDIVVNLLYWEEIDIKHDLDKDGDASKFKLEDKNQIDKYIDQIHEYVKVKIEEIFKNPDFESFGGYKYTKDSSPYENLVEISNDLEEELNSQKEYLKENLNSPNSWLYKENASTLKKILKKLLTLKLEVKNKLLGKILSKLALNRLTSYGYFQTLLYLYVYAEIIGLTKYQKFEYCVVDEGQDFSILEYAILNKIVLRGRFSIFGDLNQSVYDQGVSAWDDISEVIKEAKSAQVFELDTNYRSTKPIIDLANKILDPYTQNYLPKSINRKGQEPITKTYENPQDMINDVSLELKKELENLDKSIGVICFDEDIYQKIKDLISNATVDKDNLVFLDKSTKIKYIPKGLYLMKFDDCKGLEFAKVYILGLSLENVNSFIEAKQAFVSVTRAMNQVSIYGTK